MGTIVDATIQSEQFALDDTFERFPSAEFDILRVVTPEDGTVMPYLWATAPDRWALDQALADDASVSSVDLLSRTGGRSFYRVSWQPDVRSLAGALVEADGTLVDAYAVNGQWSFTILFPNRDAVSATYACCQEQGVDLTIRRVKCGTDAVSTERNALSDKQLEALAVAFDRGYYAVPRRMTLVDLAEEVGVSHQALSERLRRGHQVVISDLLGDVRHPHEPVNRLVGTG